MKSKFAMENDKERRLVQPDSVQVLCPTCKTGLLELESNNEITCGNCGDSFTVENRVIDLLPEFPRQRRFWQDIVDWHVFVELYESRLWRKGAYTIFFNGVTFGRELEIIMEAAHLTDGGTVLDIACGPGIYSRAFARTLNRGAVVGLDLSLPMLEYASSKAQRKGIENLRFIHGDAQDLPFPDNQFDAANCCGALHLFPDLPKALSEVRRVLKPGGRFTAGTIRVPRIGPLGRPMRDYYYRRAGVWTFFKDELVSLFEGAGLIDVTCHHAVRWWFIMSGAKPQ